MRRGSRGTSRQDRKEKARDRTERMYWKEIREYEKKSRQDGRRQERDHSWNSRTLRQASADNAALMHRLDVT